MIRVERTVSKLETRLRAGVAQMILDSGFWDGNAEGPRHAADLAERIVSRVLRAAPEIAKLKERP